MEKTIDSRIAECAEQAQRYDKWLNYLKVPNIILVGLGSLLAFLGGAAIVAEKWKDYAGYMALIGGALTGLHGWFGCETHQQKCRTVAARYKAFKLKYESLKSSRLPEDERTKKFASVEESYIEFVESIDVAPWF